MLPEPMSPDELGQRLRPYLDDGCDRLPAHVTQRLTAARVQALQRAQGVTVPTLAAAGPGGFSSWSVVPRGWSWRRGAAGLLALTMLLGGAQWWHAQQARQQRQDEVEQDVAALMGTQQPVTAPDDVR